MQKAKFRCATSKTFDGFYTGQKWNGWDCPLFTLKQALKVLEYLNPPTNYTDTFDCEVFSYDETRDGILSKTYEGGVVVSEWFDKAVIIVGVKYYDVANCDYTWEKVSKY